MILPDRDTRMGASKDISDFQIKSIWCIDTFVQAGTWDLESYNAFSAAAHATLWLPAVNCNSRFLFNLLSSGHCWYVAYWSIVLDFGIFTLGAQWSPKIFQSVDFELGCLTSKVIRISKYFIVKLSYWRVHYTYKLSSIRTLEVQRPSSILSATLASELSSSVS